MTDRPWAAVSGERAVLLRTYKRDGTAVTSPVGYGADDRALYFMTKPDTWKVKRIAHNPQVDVAAGTLRGEQRGDFMRGIARQLSGAEADHARQLITRHNRLAWFFLLRRARKRGESWVYYAVTPLASTTTPHTQDV